MKHVFLTIVGLLATMAASAYTCVSFHSGDPSILMKQAIVSYEIDWNHARVSNHDNLLFPDYLKKRGSDFVNDWPKDRKQAERYFTSRFNRKSDYLKIKEGGTPVYKMTVKPASIDVGDAASGFIGLSRKAGGCIIDGTIEFSDPATGQVLCVLDVIEAKGISHPSETIRIGMALQEIAGDIWDFVDDTVKEGKVTATKPATDTTQQAKAEQPTKKAEQPTKKAEQPAKKAEQPTKKDKEKTAKGKDKKATASKEQPQPAKTTQVAAGSQARVVMKNGSVLIGTVKAYDPAASLTLTVESITTTIPVGDIQSIETQ